MSKYIRLLFWLLLLWAPAGWAQASYEQSRSWFEGLSAAERNATQTDLLLLGHYDFLVDGQFGRGTFEALQHFQQSQGGPDTGVLTQAERRSLADLADKANQNFGMQTVDDTGGHSVLMLPTALLTRREPTDQGTSYASADGEISLETMYATLTDQSFADLYEAMVKPDPERTVTYRSFGNERFVVSGVIGDYSFYTYFINAGTEAVGYSYAWSKSYGRQGSIASVYLASHFSPLSALPPTKEQQATGDSGVRSAFVLPADEPDVIALNAEITGATPSDFDRALRARPGARILVLNSPGGAVTSALQMAYAIHRSDLTTYVPPEMGCYSACAYMFLAGKQRRADGELGVHQISVDVADLVLAQTTLGDVLDALEEFGVRQLVISHMLRTPPDDMYVFSRVELGELDINNAAPIAVKLAPNGPAEPIPAAPVAADGAFVQLSSQSSEAEARRSLDYIEGRWGKLFGDMKPEVEAADAVFQVRLPTPSLERANAICAAIKADGGGCYVVSADS